MTPYKGQLIIVKLGRKADTYDMHYLQGQQAVITHIGIRLIWIRLLNPKTNVDTFVISKDEYKPVDSNEKELLDNDA